MNDFALDLHHIQVTARKHCGAALVLHPPSKAELQHPCSTRPNRNGERVANWVLEVASRRDATFELVDLRDYPLPHLDEPLPPWLGQDQNKHSQQWAATVASLRASSS